MLHVYEIVKKDGNLQHDYYRANLAILKYGYKRSIVYYYSYCYYYYVIKICIYMYKGIIKCIYELQCLANSAIEWNVSYLILEKY